MSDTKYASRVKFILIRLAASPDGMSCYDLALAICKAESQAERRARYMTADIEKILSDLIDEGYVAVDGKGIYKSVKDANF